MKEDKIFARWPTRKIALAARVHTVSWEKCRRETGWILKERSKDGGCGGSRERTAVVLPSTGYVIWYLGHVPLRIDRPTSSQPGGLHPAASRHYTRFSVRDVGILKQSRKLFEKLFTDQKYYVSK